MTLSTKKLAYLLLLAGLLVTSTARMEAQAVPTPVGGAGSRPVAILTCQYPDKPNTYGFKPSDMLNVWMTNTGTVNNATVDDSINGLVQDASAGTINFNGSQAFGWYTLPSPSTYYTQFAYGGAGLDGAQRAGNDCIAAAQKSGVNLAPFAYVALYFNDVLASGASGESWTTNLPGTSPTLLNTLAVEVRGLTSPPLMLHEIGHVLTPDGAAHTDSQTDPLGGAAFYGDYPPTGTPPYRVAAVSPGWDASRRELMGLIPAASHLTFTGGTQTYNLSRLSQPLSGLPVAIDVPLPNGTKYVVSARTRVGYDSYTVFPDFPLNTIPAEGVMIELFTSTEVDAHVEMSNPNGDPRSTDAVWLTGQTYTDSVNGITIQVANFNATGNPTAQITISSGAKPPALAVDSGGAAANPFVADAYYSGGNTYSIAAAVDTTGLTNPAPQAVYQTQRYGNFTYTLPNLNAGATYKVRLHLAEIYWSNAGQRVFNVSINGTQVLTNFDILATTGAQNKAIIEQFPATANGNGQIVIQFTTVVDNAAINGIEITN